MIRQAEGGGGGGGRMNRRTLTRYGTRTTYGEENKRVEVGRKRGKIIGMGNGEVEGGEL